jgi:hypothetical protein
VFHSLLANVQMRRTLGVGWRRNARCRELLSLPKSGREESRQCSVGSTIGISGRLPKWSIQGRME